MYVCTTLHNVRFRRFTMAEFIIILKTDHAFGKSLPLCFDMRTTVDNSFGHTIRLLASIKAYTDEVSDELAFFS